MNRAVGNYRLAPRGKVITQCGRTFPKPQLQPADLAQALLDLERATFLTVPEAAAYLRFRTLNGFYHWLRNHRDLKGHRGHALLFRRRDLEAAVTKEPHRSATRALRVGDHASKVLLGGAQLPQRAADTGGGHAEGRRGLTGAGGGPRKEIRRRPGRKRVH